MKILLLTMPFGALDRQALGLSLLKARVEALGHDCDVRYLCFPFAETIGHDEYRWLTREVAHTAFAGEWCFTEALYGEDAARTTGYVDEILRRAWGFTDAAVARVRRIHSLAAPFIAHCEATIAWCEYDVVGFTSTFEQNLASLALAKRIKTIAPQIAIVFGGANWEGEMGLELHRRFSFVDFVCSGEADESFPALLRCLRDGVPFNGAADLPRGIVYRGPTGSISTGPAALVTRMDDLPFPDFSDYFRDLGASTVAAHVLPSLLLETSRGCWWGARAHCTFCGLNGGSMAFRSKSPERVLAEIDHLTERWGFELVEVVDNILDLSYFESVLPALARSERELQLFYEVKSNLSRDQVRILADAGVTHIQPGIESLSDRVLKSMRKGTTALRNVQLLKWCKEHEVRPDWNLLYGFPGETRDDYAAVMRLMDAIRFLDPPGACGPLRLDRFSPYFDHPETFGLLNLRPLAAYRFLYPFPDEALARVAYYFTFDYDPSVDPGDAAAEAVAQADHWRRRPDPGTLRALRCADGSLRLLDTREDAYVDTLTLGGLEQAAYELCDAVQSLGAITRHLRTRFPAGKFADGDVAAFLDSMVANRLMVSDGSHYLSLALRAPTLHPDRPASLRSVGSETRAGA